MNVFTLVGWSLVAVALCLVAVFICSKVAG